MRDARPITEDNLFRPQDDVRDFGAHGEFDDESRESSLLQEMNQRRRTAAALGAAGFLAAGAAGFAAVRRTRRGL